MPERLFCVIGATFTGNHGAEAMACVAIRRVEERVPGSRFVVFSYYPRADSRIVQQPRVDVADGRPLQLLFVHLPMALLVRMARVLGARWPDALLPGAVAQLRRSSALLDVQGISFDDGRQVVLPYKVLSVWPALLLGVPVIKLSQAMGPFRRPVNRLAARYFLRRCHMSFARGRITAGYLAALRLPKDRWETAADLAFSFREGDALSDEGMAAAGEIAERLRRRAPGVLLIGLSPSVVVEERMRRLGRDYAALLSRIVEHLVVRGHEVVVVPSCTRAASTSSRNNDLRVIDRLRQRVSRQLPTDGQERVHWVDFDVNFAGILRVIRTVDVLVASRFHAMVGGLSLGIPVAVIGWSHKYAEVLADFGCERYAIDYAGMSFDDVGALLDDVIGRRLELRERISGNLPSVRASSARQFELAELS